MVGAFARRLQHRTYVHPDPARHGAGSGRADRTPMGPGAAPRRWAAACATVLTACLASAPPTTAANDDFFGVNAQAVFYLPSSSWDAHLARMSSGGLQLARRDASWEAAE